MRTRVLGDVDTLSSFPLGPMCAEVTPTLVPDCPPVLFFNVNIFI